METIAGGGGIVGIWSFIVPMLPHDDIPWFISRLFFNFSVNCYTLFIIMTLSIGFIILGQSVLFLRSDI